MSAMLEKNAYDCNVAGKQDKIGGDCRTLKILHECSPCCRYRGYYMSAPLVADIEGLT